MSPPTSPTTPLSTRSLNTTSPTKPASEKPTEADKPKTMEYHRQVLQSKLEGEGAKHDYVSPSDNILSPCTKKLAVYKGRQFMKAKPQSLFAKQVGRNMGAGGAEAEGGVGEGKEGV